MEEVYSSLPVRLPEVNPVLHTLYHDWLQGQDSPQANILLHTQYKSQNQSQSQPPHMQWWEVMESLAWTLNGWFCWKPNCQGQTAAGHKGAPSTSTLLGLLCQTWNWGPRIQKKHILTYYADWKTHIEHASFAILKKKVGGGALLLGTFCVCFQSNNPLRTTTGAEELNPCMHECNLWMCPVQHRLLGPLTFKKYHVFNDIYATWCGLLSCQ